MKIAIAAPIASADLQARLSTPSQARPAGYLGAPLTGLLIGELLDRGHQVTAITVDYQLAAGAAVAAQGPGLDLHILPGRRHAWRPNGWRPGRMLDLFQDERQAIAQAIVQADVDVVHAHWTGEFALAALASAVPHVITAHDSPRQLLRLARGPYLALRAVMARQVLRQARCMTAVSPALAAELVHALGRPWPGATGAAAAPLVVPNPVAAAALLAGRARQRPAGRRIAMVCNGWARWKNPEPGLRAFALLRAEWPDAELHLFGLDFGPGERAEHWVQQHLRADSMHFHGHLPHGQLLRQLQPLDLLLHPALHESFGVALAEAMALGMPLVAGASSGAVPWVAGEQAWLVDVRSAPAMAQAMRQALTDDSRYALASAAGCQRVAGAFSTAAVVDAYLALYRQAQLDQTKAAAR